MTNYAELNDDNIVVNVIIADADFVATQTDKNYVLCEFGGIGWTFNGTNFIAPKPYASWSLDANNDWQAPTPKPEGDYMWDEETLAWVEVTVG